MIDAFKIAASQPWAITPDGLETVMAVLDRMGDPEALAAKLGRPLDNSRTVENRDGVALIPITGPIARYANIFSDISGATSTQILATDFQAALDDPSVRAIVLNVDSPGGAVAGIDELANAIYAARGQKPIVAYIGGTGASAAYWIASAADSIVADSTSVVGSIGIVMGHVDTSARDEKSGVKRHEIVSSVSPDKRADPTTESGRVKAQKVVDDLASVFVGTVARNRSTTPDKVATDYGRGGVHVGQAAKDAGMVDKLGSLESVIAELSATTKPFNRRYSMATLAQKGNITISSTADLQLALAAGYTPEQIVLGAQDNTAALAAARKEGVDEGKVAGLTEGKALGAQAERDRITAINDLTLKGFEKERDAALLSGASANDFAVTQAKAIKDRGVTVSAIKKDSTSASHAAPPPDEEAAAAEAKSGWDRVVAKHSGKAKA